MRSQGTKTAEQRAGIIACNESAGLVEQCEKRGLAVCGGSKQSLATLPYEKNLYLGADTQVPWELLPAAWELLESWDVMAPLWSYEWLATGAGGFEERKRAEAVCGDLRQPLYATTMVFIRRNESGSRFYECWRGVSGDAHLALLTAIHMSKPLILQLPYSWLGPARTGQTQVPGQRRGMPGSVGGGRRANLVKVEVGPNRFVMCFPGEEEKTKRHFQDMLKSRRGQ